MKKLFTLAMIALMAALPMMAQRHNYSSSTPSNRYDYERGHSRWIRNYYGKDMYFGMRIGPAFSSVSGDAIPYAGGSKTGLHLGGVVGFEITNRAPVFFETGLSYVNKAAIATTAIRSLTPALVTLSCHWCSSTFITPTWGSRYILSLVDTWQWAWMVISRTNRSRKRLEPLEKI